MADFVWLILSRTDDEARGLDAGSIITAVAGDKPLGNTETKFFRAVKAYGITAAEACALAGCYQDEGQLAICEAAMNRVLDVRLETKLSALAAGKTPAEAERMAGDAVEALSPMPPMPPILRKRRYRIPPEILAPDAEEVDFGKKVALCQDMKNGKFKYKKAVE